METRGVGKMTQPRVILPQKNSRGLQGRDLNPRPPGYEPDELPDCSTLR